MVSMEMGNATEHLDTYEDTWDDMDTHPNLSMVIQGVWMHIHESSWGLWMRVETSRQLKGGFLLIIGGRKSAPMSPR